MKNIARLTSFCAVAFGIGGLFPYLTALLLGVAGLSRMEPWLIILFGLPGFTFAAKGALGGTAIGLALRKDRKMTARLALFGAIGFMPGGWLFIFFQRGAYRELGISRPILLLGIFVVVILGLSFVANEAFREMEQEPTARKRRLILARLARLGAIGLLAGGIVFLFLHPAWSPIAAYSGVICLESALGGAALGLAFRDRRKIIALALATTLSLWIGLVISTYIPHPSALVRIRAQPDRRNHRWSYVGSHHRVPGETKSLSLRSLRLSLR